MNPTQLFARSLLAAMIAFLSGSQAALAGGGPENVFLVVNSRGAQSQEIANHYIAVLAAILERGLRDRIDYVIYSCEFPFQVECMTLLGLPNTQTPQRPIFSLTGATYLYQFLELADKGAVQLNTNFYFGPVADGQTTTPAFHASTGWLPGGEPAAQGGMHYMLCTQLGNTQPLGNTVPEIVASLRRAAAADGTRPNGTFYYMQNSDIRSQVRQDLFPQAVAELRALDVKAEVGNGVVPSGVNLNGLTTGNEVVRVRGSGSQLQPGALVDNLTSGGGQLQRVKNPNDPKMQTRLGEHMRAGAGGASGTVVEPFAIPQKFPAPSLHVHYARGASLAEAFYRSVQGPFQLLILGDPLCQPWAAIPKVEVYGVTEGQFVSRTLELAPSATVEGSGVRHFDLFVDGEFREQAKDGGSFSLDTTKLADGYHELRIVAVADTPIETQGRWIGGVVVKNGTDAVAISAPSGPRVTGPLVMLNATSTADGPIAVFHNGREVGRLAGKQGGIQILTEKLGKGPVTLIARTVGARQLVSRPVTLEIQ
jgi:hypothetical protein